LKNCLLHLYYCQYKKFARASAQSQIGDNDTTHGDEKEGKIMKNYLRWMTMLVPFLFVWACGSGQQTPKAPETTAAVARPSNPGGPGKAIELKGDPKKGADIFRANCMGCHNAEGKGGIANAGSSDGTVPALNPIDSTLVSKDDKTFAGNLDLFIEHGSTPEGKNPAIKMPAFGDQKRLTPQQIADVIAYVIGLNKR
jgi:mono/diheme cytochrome c family protein